MVGAAVRVGALPTPLAHHKQKPALRFKKGDKVSHRIFGSGAVMQIEDDLVTVDFGSVGAKRICQDFLTACAGNGDGCRPGDRILHEQWGTGVIKKIVPDNGESVISAAFPGHGMKYFPQDSAYTILT